MLRSLSMFAVLAIIPAAAFAHGEDADLAPRVEGGQIVIDGFVDATQTNLGEEEVFSYKFGEEPGEPANVLDDPGVNVQPNAGFTNGTAMGFDITEGLTYWDGTGDPVFGALPTDVELELSFGNQSITVTGSPVDGFEFLVLSGPADDHLISTITAGDGSVPPGVYAMEMRLRVDDPAIADSEPVRILFGFEVSDEIVDEAADTFEDGHDHDDSTPTPTATTGDNTTAPGCAIGACGLGLMPLFLLATLGLLRRR